MPIRQLKHASHKSENSFRTRALRSSTPRSRVKHPLHKATSRLESVGTTSKQRSKKFRVSWFQRHAVLVALIRLGLFVALFSGIVVVSAFAWYSRDLPDPNKIIERNVAQSTKMYDRTGKNLLYEIHGTQRRTIIELADIPQYAIDATIAIEDKNFFKHGGLSLRSIVKAIALEAASKFGLYRGLVPGGSTLTQQFIKNAVLTTEKSYERKIKELVLAYRMEKEFTKDQILKLYFNEIPYGSTAYGVEAASHIYFDKPAKDVTIAEAAVLAALPQAPSYYSPYGSHKDELIGRQQYILKLMVEQRYITQEQAQKAKQEKLVFKKRREDIKAPHFVFMVKEELSQRFGDRLVEQGGLKIITTLDLEKQKSAEEVINEIAPNNLAKYNAQNASLVTIDVRTGEVLALVGSKDFFDEEIDGQVNVATAPRQPGSSLKPIVYSEAFNRGFRPDTVIFDLNTSFAARGTPYEPRNYDGKERGPVTLRQALQGSLNIPGVKVLYLVGVARAVRLAQEMGYTTLTNPDIYGLSLVLGGGEVKLIEHINAYAALAREGVYKPYVSVLRVEDGTGTVLEEHKDREGKRVLPREIVRILNSILTDNEARAFIFGAQNYLTLPGRPVAAKTGTTNNYHDAWTLGYTPSVATGVWVGNSGNAEMKRGADGSVVAAPIWQKYMQQILKDAPLEQFKTPEPLPSCDKPMLCGNLGSERVVKINAETGKLASPYTPQSKIKEVVYKEVHTILQYVNKDDPTGAPLANPGDDPQYALWEKPVQEWAQKQNFITSQPPTEMDTAYLPEDQPTVTWVSPRDLETITNPEHTFTVQAQARRGVVKVSYYMNEFLIGTATQSPFNFVFRPTPLIPNGRYSLTAVASDDIGNEQRARITITLGIPGNESGFRVNFLQPSPDTLYPKNAVPSEIKISLTNPHLFKKIDFFLTALGAETFIGAKEINNQTELTQNWNRPQQAGTYTLTLIATDLQNNTYRLPGASFRVTEQ